MTAKVDSPGAEKYLAAAGAVKALKATLTVLAITAIMLVLCVLVVLFRPPESGKSMRLVTEVALPRSHSFVSATDYARVAAHTLYVAYSSENTLMTVNTQTLVATRRATGLGGLHGIAFSQNPSIGFVTMGAADRVAMIEPESGWLLGTVPAGKDPDGVIYDAKAATIYVGNGDSASATLISPSDAAHPRTIALGGEPEYPQADETTGLVYQPLVDRSQLLVIDPLQARVTARLAAAPCEHPAGQAIDVPHRRVLLGCGNRMLAVMDMDSGRIVQTLPIARFVDFIAYDPVLQRVYAAGAAGTMTVIQRSANGAYRFVENVRTKPGGHTLAVDLATHRVYVVCAGIHGASVLVYQPLP
jgi:DNA-binding beta-propeller fold protein YncE